MMLYLSLSFAFTRSHTDAISRTNTNTTYTHWQREGWWNIFDFFLPTLSQDVTLPGEWFRSTGKTRKRFRTLPGSEYRGTRQLVAVLFEMNEEKLRDGKKTYDEEEITFPLLWHSGQLTHIWAESRFKCLACGSALVRQSAVSAVLSCHRSGCHSYFMLTTPSPRNNSN